MSGSSLSMFFKFSYKFREVNKIFRLRSQVNVYPAIYFKIYTVYNTIAVFCMHVEYLFVLLSVTKLIALYLFSLCADLGCV